MTKPENAVELLPCPFCNAAAKMQTARNGYEHRVECSRCGAQSGECDFDNNPTDWQYVAKVWNTRSTPQPLPADVQGLVEALENCLELFPLDGEIDRTHSQRIAGLAALGDVDVISTWAEARINDAKQALAAFRAKQGGV